MKSATAWGGPMRAGEDRNKSLSLRDWEYEDWEYEDWEYERSNRQERIPLPRGEDTELRFNLRGSS